MLPGRQQRATADVRGGHTSCTATDPKRPWRTAQRRHAKIGWTESGIAITPELARVSDCGPARVSAEPLHREPIAREQEQAGGRALQ